MSEHFAYLLSVSKALTEAVFGLAATANDSELHKDAETIFMAAARQVRDIYNEHEKKTHEVVEEGAEGGVNFRIYADGACSGNPGPGGWAARAETDSMFLETSGYEEGPTTNNRMEMQAAIEGLKAVITHGLKLGMSSSSVAVYSDSEYVVKAMRGENSISKNKDLFNVLSSLAEEIGNVSWMHVEGHKGDPKNERVDTLAKQAIIDKRGIRDNNPDGGQHDASSPKGDT